MFEFDIAAFGAAFPNNVNFQRKALKYKKRAHLAGILLTVYGFSETGTDTRLTRPNLSLPDRTQAYPIELGFISSSPGLPDRIRA